MSAASVFQRRIDELPTNTIGSPGGACTRSAASNAAISSSKKAGSWLARPYQSIAASAPSQAASARPATIARPIARRLIPLGDPHEQLAGVAAAEEARERLGRALEPVHHVDAAAQLPFRLPLPELR